MLAFCSYFISTSLHLITFCLEFHFINFGVAVTKTPCFSCGLDRCYQTEGGTLQCCNPLCAAGCVGPKANQCHVCGAHFTVLFDSVSNYHSLLYGAWNNIIPCYVFEYAFRLKWGEYFWVVVTQNVVTCMLQLC